MSEQEKGKIIGIVIGIVIGVLFLSCSLGNNSTTTSYYMDYNDNGRMDKGEWAWDEDSKGNTIDWDSNGNGWYD